MFEKQIFLKKWKKYFCAKRSVYLREMRNYPRQLGKKYFFQKYWFFTFHTEFSKFVLLEVLQWSQLLTPIRVGVMSSYSQMWKGDGHTTVRVRAHVASIFARIFSVPFDVPGTWCARHLGSPLAEANPRGYVHLGAPGPRPPAPRRDQPPPWNLKSRAVADR